MDVAVWHDPVDAHLAICAVKEAHCPLLANTETRASTKVNTLLLEVQRQFRRRGAAKYGAHHLLLEGDPAVLARELRLFNFLATGHGLTLLHRTRLDILWVQ
eukprot:scaffold222953_cov32-Tisochrysis_lutea.AAC.3